MKSDQIATAASVGRRNEPGAGAAVADHTQAVFNDSERCQRASSNLSLVTPPASKRLHTLILTGELDGGSAQDLEAEIDRLCGEGVAGITLDLRELTYIDSTGVAVVAFRCGLCRRRGCEFTLIPGSRHIQRAFEQAGVAGLLPFQEDGDATAPPRLELTPAGFSPAIASGDRR